MNSEIGLGKVILNFAGFVNVLEMEPRAEVLVPEQDQDGQHGEDDQRGREDLVGAGGSLHHEVLVPRSGHDADVDVFEVVVHHRQPEVVVPAVAGAAVDVGAARRRVAVEAGRREARQEPVEPSPFLEPGQLNRVDEELVARFDQ